MRGADLGGLAVEILCLVVFEAPLTSILSPHKRGERKKGSGHLTAKSNWFSVWVLKKCVKALFLTRKIA
jgi:hypothetical protein